MPEVNLGTCCGSDVNMALPLWLAAGGRGVDTAYDYGGVLRGGLHKFVPGGLQSDIRAIVRDFAEPVFITTKVPAGLGVLMQPNLLGDSCAAVSHGARDLGALVLAQVHSDLQELGVAQLDLVLLHAPCANRTDNVRLWRGLELAHERGLARAIGVSNYDAADLQHLLQHARMAPAVNQCPMSLTHHDDAAIAFCAAHGITFESFGAMRGCPFDHPEAQAIAARHGVTVGQVCLRWVLQRGAVLATGLGTRDCARVAEHARTNMDLFGFTLSADEMAALAALPQAPVAMAPKRPQNSARGGCPRTSTCFSSTFERY